MSIYNDNAKTSSGDAHQAGVHANKASEKNPFLTVNDLAEFGVNGIVFIAPDGSKWKKTVDNNGNFVTTAV